MTEAQYDSVPGKKEKREKENSVKRKWTIVN